MPRSSSADAAIEQWLAELGRGAKNYVVVSSDRRVARSAQEAHARVITSEMFAGELRELENGAPASPEGAGSMGSVDEWLEIFRHGNNPGGKT